MRYISAPHRSHTTFAGSGPGTDLRTDLGSDSGTGAGTDFDMWVRIIASAFAGTSGELGRDKFLIRELTASSRAAKLDGCLRSDSSPSVLSDANMF